MSNAAYEGASDVALLDAVRMGDQGAYGTLFRRHAGPARQIAGQWLQGPAEQHELVAEAFATVLAAIRGGSGPRDNVRAYLLVTMRHLAIRWRRHRDQVDLYGTVPETSELLHDTAARSEDVVQRLWNLDMAWSAFRSLPPRWRMVLWRTEVESSSPTDIAPMLGITPNGVAALAMRAREGLRQAYLQVQVPSTNNPACQRTRHHMGTWVRGGLPRQRAQPIAEHVTRCADCGAVASHLAEANRELRPSRHSGAKSFTP
ncbi:RNA polymerase sigma factor [Kibdelosporangium phytohabitans]|uniref:RNA polymerase subunit sigma n=1 Tax=Kibdelosporangium phytohabitans TaxID=860235 RepID=A0A0N9HZ93_9PSEU|nr:sigma-70 family RNA polymerase sigma factor [Kibdelosporangium phytohabitans]ALG10673.1 RNA polymerase subunit sigma [Kibdelosporangium phytohabitans]MBE1461800.1 RNA polymerase sigma factor (sigma-70 family) [Kibdelosporangium phytohabitans]